MVLTTSKTANRGNRTLDEVITSLTGYFFITTKKAEVDADALKVFVGEARNKNMNDFNIARLVTFDGKPLTALMK